MRESFQKESKSNGGSKVETPLHLNDQRQLNKTFYYIDTSVLLENTPLVKFIKTTSGTRVVYFS